MAALSISAKVRGWEAAGYARSNWSGRSSARTVLVFGDNQRTLQRVLQFADIAGPVILVKQFLHVRMETVEATPDARCYFACEIIGQREDVPRLSRSAGMWMGNTLSR